MSMMLCEVCNRVTHHLLNSCTAHSKWPSLVKRQLALTVDFKRTSSDTKDLPTYVPPMAKVEYSNRPLLSRRISKSPVSSSPHCVGCYAPVIPGFCYAGSVIAGVITIERETTTPVVGVMRVLEETILLGGELTTKRIQVMKRNKGYLCDTCASNYSTIERVKRDGSIEIHPVVKTDPLSPSVVSASPLYTGDELRSYKRGKAFNTRTTQGRRGRRV